MAEVAATFAATSVRVTQDQDKAYVHLCGDIDLASAVSLDEAAEKVSRLAPDGVFVDLGAVRFADATLLNFIARLVRDLRPSLPVVLCRPTTTTRHLLHIARMEATAPVRGDLPLREREVRHLGGFPVIDRLE